MAERRQYIRYGVRDNAFEVFSSDSKITSTLKNISPGGLAFQYSPVKGRKAESATIDIMAKSPDPFYLPGVDCRTVYDISALVENRTFTGAATRLAGVRFIRLDREQEQQLALFIKKYGLELLEDPG
jgi:c-di-GMP-binding flagellar brake protein YcgR